MKTYLNELINEIEIRWSETDILIEHAKTEELKTKDKNQSLYNALCRASVLFIAAHLESFIKDTAKALIEDINTFSTFKECSIAIKKAHCKAFTATSIQSIELYSGEYFKDLENRTNLLIDIFNTQNSKLNPESFLINNIHGNNQKNPTPSLIERICNNFGIKKIFNWLDNSDLDKLFEGTKYNSKEIISLKYSILEHITKNTESYPYSVDINIANIKEPKENTSNTKKQRSFWETFIDDVLKIRHGIAHGSTTENNLSTDDLSEFRVKVTILEYSILLILAYKITKERVIESAIYE